jgi:quercetin dioxygenase-like cupin family protein
VKVASFLQRKFDPAKLRKLNLFETDKFFCDVYCLEPGQGQQPHTHEGSDKLFAVLEGVVVASIAGEEQDLHVGDVVLAPAGSVHGVFNRSSERAALLVFMAPHP